MGRKSEKKNSFILYSDSEIFVSKLNDADAGKLFKDIFAYVNRGEIPDDDEEAPIKQIAWEIIKNYLDKNAEEYAKVCEIRSKSAKKRYENNSEKEKAQIKEEKIKERKEKLSKLDEILEKESKKQG